MKSQKKIVSERGITRISRSRWPCTVIYLLVYTNLCLCFMNLVQLQPLLLVHAANRNGNYPSTVRPIPTTTSTSSSSRMRNRLSFLPSSRKNNSRKAANEAYLHHLQNELNIAQRQLYISQNTCSTLRRRFEDQRMETLELMALSSTRSSASDVSVSDENDIDIDVRGEEEEQQIQALQQKLEIEKLQILLQEENEKYQQQKDKLNLLMEELKEMQIWKEEEEENSNNEGKLLLQYEQQLQESNKKQHDYAEQVELLTLKLEAAEFAAMQSRGEEAKNESSWERRANELKSELENVQAKYSQLLLVHSTQEEEQQQQQRVEEEMDTAIVQAVESALEKVEREWETRYATLEEQLNASTEWAASLEAERDAALTRVAEAAACASAAPSSAIQAEEEEEKDVELLKQRQQQQQTQMREELRTELTNTLTNELTEKLTMELTDTLAQKMERKYKKKMKRLRHEHKEKQDHLRRQQQQTASSSEEKRLLDETMAQQRQQILEEEMKRLQEKYDGEFQSKLRELEIKGEEQVRIQKERMRKLVRALLEREAKQKKNGVKEATLDGKQSAKKAKSSSSQRKKKEKVDGESIDGEGDGEEEVVPISSISSSRKKGRSKPGVVPVRGNR